MRILFFMPLAGRTGSEIALFNLICRAKQSGWDVAVVCRTQGELLAELPSGIPIYIYETWGLMRRAYAAAYRRLRGSVDKFLTATHEEFRPDVWYVNTVLQADVVRHAEKAGIPTVLHVHELEQILDRVSVKDVATLVSYPQLVIASSETAREVFRVLGRHEAAEVCYATIDPQKISWSEGGRACVRERIGAGPDTFVWAMSGTVDPNKNPVRFAEIAAEMLRRGLDVRFIWIGKSETGYGAYATAKAEDLGVAGKLFFVGERTHDYYDHLSAADGLVITSFKESFSIAAAEAAYLGKPIVSFDSGGVREIVRAGMGTIINSWNTDDLIGAMISFMRGETHFDPLVSKERVREFYVDRQGERWQEIMRQHFARGETPTQLVQSGLAD